MNKFTRKKEIVTTKIERNIEETTVLKPQELINPLDNTRTAFFFRLHVTGYIESGNVSLNILFSFMMVMLFTLNTILFWGKIGIGKKVKFLVSLSTLVGEKD